MSLANEEAMDFISRREKANSTIERRGRPRYAGAGGTGDLSQEEYEHLVPIDVAAALQAHWDNGTFSLKANRPDINCV